MPERRDRGSRQTEQVGGLRHQQVRGCQAPCGEHGAARLARGRRDGRQQQQPAPGAGTAVRQDRHASMRCLKDVIAARGKPNRSVVYATNKFEVAKHHVESMERQGSLAVAVTVDSNSNRLQEQGLRFARIDTRQCDACHDRSSLAASQRNKPMYEGADLSGLRDIRSSAMSWDYLKRIRDATKMKMVIKGIMAWEDAKIAAENGIDAIIVSTHGGR